MFATTLLTTALLSATPVEVTPGQKYAAGTTVSFGALGVVFDIPDKWFGTMSADGETFLFASNTEAGLMVATAEEGEGIDSVLASLNQPIPFEGLVLQPVALARRTRLGAEQRYTAKANGQSFAGLAKAVVGRHVAVGFVAIGPASSEKSFNRILTRMAKRLRFVKRKKPSGGAWQKRLAGYALQYLKTGGGLSTRHTIRLCTSGAYRESGSEGYLSGGFTAAGVSGGAGRWTIRGDVLELVSQDGRTSTYRLTSDKGKTFLNGTRYFVANPAGC